jgi:autotransporter-associated beta strand protein
LRPGASILGICFAVLLPYAPRQALAASETWSGGGPSGNWSNSANWSGGAAPGSTSGITSPDIALFNTAVSTGTWGGSAGNPVVIDQATQNIGGITFSTSAGSYFIGSTGGNPLLLSSTGGIQIASSLSGSGITETINAPLIIEPATTTSLATYTFANSSGIASDTLFFGGAITGGATTALNGSDSSPEGGAIVLLLTGSNAGANTIAGLISDGASQSSTPVSQAGIAINKQGSGAWYLTNNGNTYTGETAIQGGILNVSSLSDYGVPSAIGARTASEESNANGGIGLLIAGGTLQYTGATNQSTDRQQRRQSLSERGHTHPYPHGQQWRRQHLQPEPV